MRMVIVCGLCVVLFGCLSAAQYKALQDGAGSAGEALGAAAPLLPPPFGAIAGVVAMGLSAVASIGANKVSNEKFKKKEKPSALVRYATDYISPILAAVAVAMPALRAAGLITISDVELTLLMGTFGTPVVTKKVMRK